MTSSNYILFDPEEVSNLLPLAYTKAVADFRIGIFTIKEKWNLYLKSTTQILTRDYLQAKYEALKFDGDCTYINNAVLPNHEVVKAINGLKLNQALFYKNDLIALKSNETIKSLNELYQTSKSIQKLDYDSAIEIINHNWDIFTLNGNAILNDIQFVDYKEVNDKLEYALSARNKKQIYFEEGAIVEACILDASSGPIYIGKGAKVLDGAIIKGPTAICNNAVVKAGAKIYGETTIGPHCKVGGEVSNAVIMGYSNKGHDGYLGNSVIGEWCNLGADTNTSNLKNNYSLVKSWNYSSKTYINSNLQFCGLIMGDHSKSGINTMFNTATVVGVAANIYGGDFPPKFIPSFSWGGSSGFATFKLEKAFEMATNMMKRRGIEFTTLDKQILEYIFNEDAPFRN